MAETGALVSKNFLRVLVDPANPNIEFVYDSVHGLNPTNTKFHAELTWTAEGKLWLRDFLPEQLPKARVLLYGYNSNVAFETSTAGVLQQAELLLNRLRAKRKGAPDRPLFFVCHSLGGIVVKRALVHAKSTITYDPICRATYGIAFFGTPHQGGSGNLVRVGNVAATIGQGLFGNPSNTFLEALRANSVLADHLVQDFRQQLEDYYVLSFYETKPMGRLGVIVDQESATLGLPTQRELQIPVDADHANVCKFPTNGDDYELVADNLVDLAERAVKTFADQQRMEALSTPAVTLVSEQNSRIFMVPHTSNPDFVGRERILETLKGRLGPSHKSNRSHSQTRVALYGLGGVGKSQIAIEYAYWVRDQFPKTSVFWVHGSSTERCLQTLSQIGVECKIAGIENPNADKLKLVKAWLESTSGGIWLMIIDNADDSEVFFKDDKHDSSNFESISHSLKSGLGSYIPECSHGSILITTRNKQAGIKLTRNRNLIEVAEMRQTEAIELIRKRIGGAFTDDNDLAVLTDELGNLPLTLIQAAAFVQENTISIKAYLDILQSSDEARVNLLSQGFEDMGRDSEVPNAVTTTWMISFKRIKEQQPRAARLLSLMSFFNRQAIPKSLLSQYERESLKLEKALGVLKAYSFITASVQDKSFNMHRLIHLVTRKWLEIEGEATKWAKRGLKAVQKSFPWAEYENWTACAALLPHSYAVLDSAEDETATQADLLHNTASYLSDLGQWTEAERLYSQAVKIKIMVKGLEHPGTLTSMSNLAITYSGLGEIDKAKQLKEEVLELEKRVLGSEHPDTLMSMHNLASTYSDLGEIDKAKQLNEEVLELRKRVLGSEHPDTLMSMNNLASTYSDLGEPDKAMQLEEEVLELRKRVLGSEHPVTLISMNNLASTYSDLGEPDKAKQLEEEVLELRKRVLGSEHPVTLISMNNLAVTWAAQKRDQDAMDLMLECVRLSNKVLGSDHPDIIYRKEWLRIWQNKSPDCVEGNGGSSSHAEGAIEVDWQDESLDDVEEELREKKRACIK